MADGRKAGSVASDGFKRNLGVVSSMGAGVSGAGVDAGEAEGSAAGGGEVDALTETSLSAVGSVSSLPHSSSSPGNERKIILDITLRK